MSTIETRPEIPDLLTITEAAAILRVTRSTAYKLVKSGALPAHRIGGSLRVNRAELNAVLELPAHEEER